MRILHVIPAVAPRYGGPSTTIVSMNRALLDCGVETLVATTDADGEARLDIPLGVPMIWKGVPTVFFRRDFSEAYKYSRGLARWLRDHVGDFSAVHIHAVLSHSCLAAATACERAHVPYIVRPLGTIAPWSLDQKPCRKRLLMALRATDMLRGAAAIHYTSEGEKIAAERSLGLSRGVVIPLGIDSQRLVSPVVSAGERASDPYVLVLSRLHPKKNLEALIESFVAAVAGRDTRWRLVVAGGGPEEYVGRLERLVRDRQAERFVTFAGWVDGDTKRRLIEHASLFAMPSLQENFGMSLAETLAAGVPALVSEKIDIASEVSAARAGWVVGTDVESLRMGLVEAISNPAERESRGRAARRLAERYAWPVIAGQLSELYQHVHAAPVALEVSNA